MYEEQISFLISQVHTLAFDLKVNFYIVSFLITFLVSRNFISPLRPNSFIRSIIPKSIIFFIKWIILIFLFSLQFIMHHSSIEEVLKGLDLSAPIFLTFIVSIILIVLGINTKHSSIFIIFNNDRSVNCKKLILSISYFILYIFTFLGIFINLDHNRNVRLWFGVVPVLIYFWQTIMFFYWFLVRSYRPRLNRVN